MIPTPDAFQKTRNSQPESNSLLDRILGRTSGVAVNDTQAYIAKLSPDGRRMVYFSWLGGSAFDEIETEGVSDPQGNIYVAGGTASPDFPVSPGAAQTLLRGGDPDNAFAGDAFLVKVNDDGTLGFSTLYGGSEPGNENFFGPVVTPAGDACATGRFRSTDLPLTAHALQRNKAGSRDDQDAVLVCFSQDGKQLRYASYYGGSGIDHGRLLAIGPDGNTFVIVGETRSTDLPLENAYNSRPSGAFIAKFRLNMTPE
jgi:hypothetical protein